MKTPIPEWLTIPETSKLIHISTKTLYRWIRLRILHAKHFKRERGKPYRIAKTELEKFVGPL